MPLRYDEEWAEATPAFRAAMASSKPAVHDISSRREALDAMIAGINATMAPLPSHIGVDVHSFQSYDGTQLSIHQFALKSNSEKGPRPALFYIHGGGMIHGKASDISAFMAEHIQECGIQVLAVDFRIAPEHPHPTPLEDCFAGLKWVQEHAAALNVDPGRIAAWGHSSGAGMAAGLALMARDRGLEPKLAKQILISPMLDSRTATKPVDKEIEPFLVAWNWNDNLTGWSAYLGRDWVEDGVVDLVYASPSHAKTLKGLPDTYIDVAALDLFRDECVDYAAKLAKDGVYVEFHLYAGVPHVFMPVAPNTDVAKRAKANQLAAFRSF
ncbi:arylesterase/monooxygenase [Xylogone sp. PMI_703]|nr:arylesterase/monooxygenase [Xylogone sp. PMI_703]